MLKLGFFAGALVVVAFVVFLLLNTNLFNPRNMPDWIRVAPTAEGGAVFYNFRTMTKGADGITDIWLQVRWGHEQIEQRPGAARDTIFHYELEREHYRINCRDHTFALVERQILGANEQVAQLDRYPETFRPIPEAGGAAAAVPIACRS